VDQELQKQSERIEDVLKARSESRDKQARPFDFQVAIDFT
jgi:hypothetical protein